MPEAWPLSTFPVKALQWKRRLMRFGGGLGVLGPSQVGLGGGGGWWEARLPGSVLVDAADALEWEGRIDDADGGFKVWEVPYIREDQPSGTVAKFGAAAARNATQVRVTRVSGFSAPLKRGMVFGVSHATQGKRIYRIKRVVTANISAGVDLVVLNLPLREAVANNQAVDFNTPACVMILDDPNDDAYPEFDGAWQAEVGVNFREAVEQDFT